MSDELKKIYASKGLLRYYFDKQVPQDLYRFQKTSETRKGRPFLEPHPGYPGKNGKPRLPDVKIVERSGQRFVLGCRCTRGSYRGLSLTDKISADMVSVNWFKLNAGATLPEALAITQDGDFKDKPNHFTLCPKDDMLESHFLKMLQTLSESMAKVT